MASGRIAVSTNRGAARHGDGLGAVGVVVALLVAAMFAANVVAMKVVVDATAPLLSVALRMAAVLLPFALIREGGDLYRLALLSWQPMGWFVFSVVGSTIAGQGALAWLLQRHPVSSVMADHARLPGHGHGLRLAVFQDADHAGYDCWRVAGARCRNDRADAQSAGRWATGSISCRAYRNLPPQEQGLNIWCVGSPAIL